MTTHSTSRWIGSMALIAAAVAAPRIARADRMTAKDVVKVAAAPGLPTVGKWKPTWCGQLGGDGNGYGGLVRDTQSQYIWDQLPQAIERTCLDPDNEAFQTQLGMYMQRWVNETGASPKQIAEFLTLWADEDDRKAQGAATCAKLPELDEAPSRAKAFRHAERAVFGCTSANDAGAPLHIDSRDSEPNEFAWHFDRSAAVPSQVVGLYRLLKCVGDGGEATMHELTRWATCRLDLGQVSQRALEAELKAGGHNEFARITATQALATVTMRARALETVLVAKTGADPELKSVLIDAATAGWKEWEAAYTENQAAVDAAWAYEDKFFGIRKSAAKGCLPEVETVFKDAIGKRKGATVQELIDAGTGGVGGVILEHLRSCLAAEGLERHAALVTALIESGMPVRGPRTAAQVAMMKVVGPIVSDRPGFALTADMLDLNVRSPGVVGSGRLKTWYPDGGAEVKSVKVKDGKLFVTFKTVTSKEQERECTPTSRIVMWRPDGTPIYAENCRYTGRTVTHNDTATPFWTLPVLGSGIKVGAYVKVSTFGNQIDGASEGVPVEVWSNKDMKKLVAVFGLGNN